MKKLLKAFTVIFLAIQLMVLNSFLVYSGDLESYLELERYRQETSIPSLRMTSQPNIAVEPGTTKTIELKFKNIGGYTAKNVIIQPVQDDSTVPFVMDFLNNANEIITINPNVEVKVPMDIIVDDNAEAKTYSITFKYTFFNLYKKEFKGEDTFYIKVQPTQEQTAPNLSLTDFVSAPNAITENSKATVSATLINIGAQDATDIQVSLEGLTSEAISISNGSNSKIFSKLGGNETANVVFEIATAEKMNTGNYPITFKITYKDADKNDYSKEQQYFVNVVGNVSDETKGHVRLSNVVAPTSTYVVGSDFKISMNIVNIGLNDAKNIKITAKPVDSVVVSKSASIQMVDLLASNQSKPIEFLFAGTANASSQNYAIEFIVEYEDGTKDSEGVLNKVSFSQFAGVNISNPKKDEEEEEEEKEEEEEDNTVKDVPKVIIQKYECDPIIVKAGTEFNLSMVYENTHQTKTIRNIKAYLTVTDSDEKTNASIFTPVNSSNTFYIDSIPPKGTAERTIRLYAIPDAQPITYSINVNFEYEDDNFNEYKTTEFVGINVKQESKLDMAAINLPPEAIVGQPVSIFFEFYNIGKVTLSNFTIELEGDLNSDSKKTFYGNLESGSSEYYENSFFPLQPGELSGKIKISYDDPSGEHFERIEDFTINVSEMIMEDPMMMEDIEAMNMSMNGGGIFSNKPLIIGIVIVIIIIVSGVIVLLVRRKKKKGLTFDE